MGYKKTALYCEGIFKNGYKKMFVSRGIGTSHFPIRLFRQPEVVVFHFNAAKDTEINNFEAREDVR
jgi:predicted MPP superfamily phosphohydrolase